MLHGKEVRTKSHITITPQQKKEKKKEEEESRQFNFHDDKFFHFRYNKEMEIHDK